MNSGARRAPTLQPKGACRSPHLCRRASRALSRPASAELGPAPPSRGARLCAPHNCADLCVSLRGFPGWGSSPTGPGAFTSRPKCVHLGTGRQTRIARICGMARVVDHFLGGVTRLGFYLSRSSSIHTIPPGSAPAGREPSDEVGRVEARGIERVAEDDRHSHPSPRASDLGVVVSDDQRKRARPRRRSPKSSRACASSKMGSPHQWPCGAECVRPGFAVPATGHTVGG
jgi:hypothetical protein